MIVAGIDIGFHAVKALTSNHRSALFPSEVGTPHQTIYSLNDRTRQEIVLTLEDGSQWQVSQTALKSAYNSGRQAAQWITSPSYRVLLAAALSELFYGGATIRVVTGLPLEHYTQLADQVRAVFLGEHRFLRHGRHWQTITISEVVVVTQPYGTLLQLALNDTGAITESVFATDLVGVVDIGGLTLNLLACQALDEMGLWTAGDDLGLLKALWAIARDLRARYPGFAPETREVAQWVRQGWFPYQDQQLAISDYAQPRLKPVARIVVDRLSEIWPEPGRLAGVALTGGGALALQSLLTPLLTGFPPVTVPENPVTANAVGYLKLARRLWGG